MKANLRTTIIVFSFVGFYILLAASMCVVAFARPILFLNETQILYLFSTSAQVLAGIYGLTLTGFVFFRNELSREEFADDTLADAIKSLKQRYFSLLVFITTLVFGTLLLSNLAISHEAARGEILNTVIINAGQAAFVTSLAAIAFFIFDVMYPDRIEAASEALKDKIDPTHNDNAKGSLEDFVKNYNQIEALLAEYGLMYENGGPTITFAPRPMRRPSNARLAEILYRNEKIEKSLFDKLRNLITLRNSIIHGADPVVSKQMVEMSTEILGELRDKFSVREFVEEPS